MADARILFPCPGCLVECMQGNRPVLHWILDSGQETVRLLAPNGREASVTVSRLLPWYGPAYSPVRSREEIATLLREHAARREAIAADIAIMDIWELAQGEVGRASAFWLAELAWEAPDPDQVAAMGHAALACKTHFKFSPPDFTIFDPALVARKTAEHQAACEREAVASLGGEFFRTLWAVHEKKRGPLSEAEYPVPEKAAVFARMIRDRLVDPETRNDSELWKLLVKSLPDDTHLALHLATAWGLVGDHHNFLLDRAGYAVEEGWDAPYADEVAGIGEAVARAAAEEQETAVGPGGAPFISIDPATTADVDDAFSVCKHEDGTFSLSLAFACPARFWPFGGGLDKAVSHRASSLYLPEAEYHMMPGAMALALFSLLEHERRPALVLEMQLSARGEVLAFTPRLSWVRLAANLSLPGSQAVLDGPSATVPVTAKQIRTAAPYAAMMQDAWELSRILQQRRIEAGAVITERPEPDVRVEYEDGKAVVTVCHAPDTHKAQTLVGEFMILANATLAGWAVQHDIALLFRTQEVRLPKEFAGIWTEPEDIARIVKHLPPSCLELTVRPHAGLGVPVYAPLTSSIRRYTDLLNTAQICSYLATGAPRLTGEALGGLLPTIAACAEAAARIQRYRPHYWKLLFYKQMGVRMWWDAVVVEENDAFAALLLPLTRITVRAGRKVIGDKVFPGQRLKVRLGKVSPLYNEIRVMGVTEQ